MTPSRTFSPPFILAIVRLQGRSTFVTLAAARISEFAPFEIIRISQHDLIQHSRAGNTNEHGVHFCDSCYSTIDRLLIDLASHAGDAVVYE